MQPVYTGCCSERLYLLCLLSNDAFTGQCRKISRCLYPFIQCAFISKREIFAQYFALPVGLGASYYEAKGYAIQPQVHENMTTNDCLPPNLQLIGETELGETDQVKYEALKKLNHLLDEETELHSSRENEFLLRFLRVRKYDVNVALKNIKDYYRLRKECTTVFEDFVPSRVKLIVRRMAMVLPQRDAHGRPVLLLKPGLWDPQTVPHSEVMQALVLVLEYLTADPVAQTVGVCVLQDNGGLTLDKMIYINFGLVKSFARLFLACSPIRVKAIHIVKGSQVFNMAYAMIRPFLSKKISDRIHLHGEEFERLYNDLPVSILPKEYGGMGPDLDFEAYWSSLEQAEAYFVENKRYGYIGKEEFSEEVEITAF